MSGYNNRFFTKQSDRLVIFRVLCGLMLFAGFAVKQTAGNIFFVS